MGGSVAEISLPAGEFALAQTTERFDDIACEIERVVAYDADHVMPYVWIDGPDDRELEAVLEEDDSVAEFERIADVEGEGLYRMEWVARIETLARILVEEEGAILSAQGNSEEWLLRILCPAREALSRTYDYCTECGLTMDVMAVYEVADGRKGRYGLTGDQQDTLVAAYDAGYYDIPRETSMTDLAGEMGIPRQSLSERLRRAHHTLVENTVVIGNPTDDGAETSRSTPRPETR